jgi:hypothetical protein
MAESILIWEFSESSTGGSSWTDEIRCTRRKDGTCSLQQRKNGDDGTLSFAGTTRIRSPQVFVQVITKMGNLFGYGIDTEDIADEICERLDKLDSEFSGKIRAYIGTLR